MVPHVGAWDYIESTRDMVRDLERRVRQAKTNVEVMCNVMEKWCEVPLYQRKDRKGCLLNIEVRFANLYAKRSCLRLVDTCFCA